MSAQRRKGTRTPFFWILESCFIAPVADAGCVGFAVRSKLRAEESVPFPALEVFETDSFTLWCRWSISSEQQRPLH